MIEQRLFATIRDLEYEVERYKVYCQQLENELKKFDNQKTQNMIDKKQTAVEFLEKQYYDNDYNIFQENFEQAKAMEKKQMIDFGFDTYCFISGIMKVPFEQLSENRLNAEHNYKENYEK
jgi:predicted RNase H-like nuclease (RuvC/YqgF family)